jgi:CheY-like chemotaxis protein
MDADGRMVIPKALRVEHGPHGAVIVADLQMPVLTVEDVREVLEQVRR